jgi:hypothetical protein
MTKKNEEEGEEGEEFAGQGKGEKKSSRFSTLSSKFSEDLNSLIASLSLTESHFIRYLLLPLPSFFCLFCLFLIDLPRLALSC